MLDIQSLTRRIDRLQGQRSALSDRLNHLLKTVGIAKARQSRRDAVDQVLETLESRFHARSLGALEGLLGAFIEDVIRPPESDEKKLPAVSMEMDTLRGLPALQVSVRNGDHLEDALHGRGGAVTNILSAGLRFAALARTGNDPIEGFVYRPFIILDEADCWIQGDRVPAFSEVVHQLAKEMNLQVLMISHHSADRLKGYPVHLEKVYPDMANEDQDDGLPFVKVRAVPIMKKSEHGFRSITLRNFMSHKESVIPLSSGVTLLTGDNDIGKSAVAEAFRSICYNDGNDTVIRHGADQADVDIHLENDEILRWIRVRKGAPKVRYQLINADGKIIKETPSPKQVPDWVRNLLGIDLLRTASDAMDVQIGDQKSPVFLLDKSPAQRAAILDMGRESQHLRKLRDHWKKKVDGDRKTIRDGERYIDRIQVIMKHLDVLDDLQEECETYNKVVSSVADKTQKNLEWHNQIDKQMCRSSVLNILNNIPATSLLPERQIWVNFEKQEKSYQVARKIFTKKEQWDNIYGEPLHTPELPYWNVRISDQFRLFTSAGKAFQVYDLWVKVDVIPVFGGVPLPDIYPVREKWLIAYSASKIKKRMDYLVHLDSLIQSFKNIKIEPIQKSTHVILKGYQQGLDAQSVKLAIRDSLKLLKEEESERDAIELKRRSYLNDWGVCPFCGVTTSDIHQTHV